MSDRRPAIRVDDSSGERTIALESLLTPSDADQVETDANAWIKSLRHARIGDGSFRDRFRHRGDSLWWFAELYLHKTRAIATAHATIRALEHLVEAGRPRGISLTAGTADVSDSVQAFCRAHRIPFEAVRAAKAEDVAWQGRAHIGAAALRHVRSGSRRRARAGLAAFVHSAFWREETSDEAYVGPVLRELATRVAPSNRSLVGLGPRTNFRARGWRARLRELKDPTGIIPIETFSSWRSLGGAREVWREREHTRRALEDSDDIRERSHVLGCDLYPLVKRQLAGLAYLQFPWSALAMEEASSALDALQPDVAFTYAEAGGWGRALALESRRRGIPLVALQHGFIYRHWLNYQHEADEVHPSATNIEDAGFPAPALTLLHDELAARHLRDVGRFRPDSLKVVGSTRLDGLVASARSLDEPQRARLRQRLSAQVDEALIVVAAKYTQIGPTFPAIVGAVRQLRGVRLVVKCHPAETPEPYLRDAGGQSNVTVAAADVDLGSLMAISRVLVTVNSTAAIEAMVLGVPSLVVALPNNLTPFVDAGVMAGVRDPAAIRESLEALLYDEACRVQLAGRRAAFLEASRITSDGRAAERAADAIVQFMRR